MLPGRHPTSPGTLALIGLAIVLGPSVAQKDDRPAKAQPIPLDSVYVTNEGTSLKRVGVGHDNIDEQMWAVLYKRSTRVGLSNVFLVRGADITAAVQATTVALGSGVGADEPISADDMPKDGRVWVVAHLGVAGSTPEARIVKGVERTGNRVRVVFAKGWSLSNDVWPYLVWAPLGSLGAGTYVLELYDTQARQVVLGRTVRVTE